MSCGTLAQQLVRLNVTMGALPEGFCPTSMQELANAIVARMIVTPNQTSSSFAIGSIPPSSNVGPWFKDCETWFVFDDATGTYVPMTKGGFSNLQYFSASGTFVVPDFTYKLKIQAFGGGGGGFDANGGNACAAGGGGGYGMSIVTVTPGQAITIVIGSGGVGGAPGANGGATTILGKTAAGGSAATSQAAAGSGGAATGFDLNFTGQSGGGNLSGVDESEGGYGGDAAGWGGKGGAADTNNIVQRNGLAPGGGGAGGSTGAPQDAGDGAAGGVLVEW